MLLKQPYIGPKSIIFEVISVVIPVISVNRCTVTRAPVARLDGINQICVEMVLASNCNDLRRNDQGPKFSVISKNPHESAIKKLCQVVSIGHGKLRTDGHSRINRG